VAAYISHSKHVTSLPRDMLILTYQISTEASKTAAPPPLYATMTTEIPCSICTCSNTLSACWTQRHKHTEAGFHHKGSSLGALSEDQNCGICMLLRIFQSSSPCHVFLLGMGE